MSPNSDPPRGERRVVLAVPLHLRPATAVVKAAAAHPGVRVELSRPDGRAAGAGELLRLMSLGAVAGTELVLRAYASAATGEDVVEAALAAVTAALT